MSFLTHFLEHTSHYESPTSFWKWSSFAAISAVLRDSVYYKSGEDPLYPNFYTLLLSDSAVQRKGRPVAMCEKLVKEICNTKIISGRSSIQAILDELSHTETNAKTGRITKGGSAIFFAPELAAGLVADIQSVGILTDIYDFKNDYTQRLRGAGKMRIEKMVFSMFAASNEALLRQVYDSAAVQGGLLGRTFLVVPDEFRPSASLLKSPDLRESYLALVRELGNIASLSGEFDIDAEAIKAYEKWYDPFRMSYKDRPDKSGIIGRIHTGVLKLSMVLAANDLTMVIKKEHVEKAIDECLFLMPNYNSFVISSGKSTVAEAGGILLAELTNAKGNTLTRRDILRAHWHQFDADILDKLVVTLEGGGILRQLTQGSEITYCLTEKGKEILKVSQGSLMVQ